MERYKYAGRFYWFDPEKAPEGAVPVKVAKPKDKAAKPANKSRKTRKKAQHEG